MKSPDWNDYMVATVKDIMRMYVHYHKIKNGRLSAHKGSVPL